MAAFDATTGIGAGTALVIYVVVGATVSTALVASRFPLPLPAPQSNRLLRIGLAIILILGLSGIAIILVQPSTATQALLTGFAVPVLLQAGLFTNNFEQKRTAELAENLS